MFAQPWPYREFRRIGVYGLNFTGSFGPQGKGATVKLQGRERQTVNIPKTEHH